MSDQQPGAEAPATGEVPAGTPQQDPSDPRPTWGDAPASPKKPASWKKTVGAVAIAAVVVGGGTIAVTAASAGSEGSTAASAGRPGGYGMGMGMPGGMGRGGQGQVGDRGGFGLGTALHGEFVTGTAAGGFTTRRLHTGAVTALSADSVSVKSEDDYTATYAVGDAAVSGVAVGDTVTVIATVGGDTATLDSISIGTGAAADQPPVPGDQQQLPGQQAPGQQQQPGQQPGGGSTEVAPTTGATA